MQDNLSRSVRGSSRPAFSAAKGASKACDRAKRYRARCRGRCARPTFGKHVAVDLNDENRRQFFVAHGFVVPSESADFFYKCDELYSPADEKVLCWNVAVLGIDWGVKDLGIDDPIVSARDQKGRTLAELAAELPRFEPV